MLLRAVSIDVEPTQKILSCKEDGSVTVPVPNAGVPSTNGGGWADERTLNSAPLTPTPGSMVLPIHDGLQRKIVGASAIDSEGLEVERRSSVDSPDWQAARKHQDNIVRVTRDNRSVAQNAEATGNRLLGGHSMVHPLATIKAGLDSPGVSTTSTRCGSASEAGLVDRPVASIVPVAPKVPDPEEQGKTLENETVVEELGHRIRRDSGDKVALQEALHNIKSSFNATETLLRRLGSRNKHDPGRHTHVSAQPQGQGHGYQDGDER